ISVVVSSGTAPVTTAIVPNVAGQTETAARTQISGARLTPGAANTNLLASHPTIPAGSVISTSPAIGTTQPLGTTIILTISSGPAAAGVGPVQTMANPLVSTGTGVRTTAAFNLAAGDMIVAFVASDGPPAANAQAVTITAPA